jgi:signal transduction histidine kinase
MGNPIHAAAVGIPVEVWQQPAAALIVRGKGGAEAERMSLMAAAAPLITAILEREDLLGRRGTSGEAIVAATERRLARLRYDLHDGPQQDLVLLAEDLHLFSSQLRAALEGHSMKDRLLGELDDLQSKLVALDGDLRRISQAVQSPFLQSERVADSLAELVDDFTARTRIKPNLSLRGDLSRLTDSQQITLLSVIREALSNIREHSGARKVTITVTASTSSVDAKVTDDGRGFDPETTLVQAAREGHLGLVGMHERVRLLGGTAQIESRQGGPTVIAVRLPAGAPPAPTDDG